MSHVNEMILNTESSVRSQGSTKLAFGESVHAVAPVQFKSNVKFDWDVVCDAAAAAAVVVSDHWLNQFFISNVVKCEIIYCCSFNSKHIHWHGIGSSRNSSVWVRITTDDCQWLLRRRCHVSLFVPVFFFFCQSKSTWNAESIIFTWERTNGKHFGIPQPVVCSDSSLFRQTESKEKTWTEKLWTNDSTI